MASMFGRGTGGKPNSPPATPDVIDVEGPACTSGERRAADGRRPRAAADDVDGDSKQSVIEQTMRRHDKVRSVGVAIIRITLRAPDSCPPSRTPSPTPTPTPIR